MNAPAVPLDLPVTVSVKVDHASLLSTVHEPGDPVGGWLQIVSTGAYVALEFDSAATVDEVVDRLIGLSATLAEAEARLDVFGEELRDALATGLPPRGRLTSDERWNP